MYLKDLRAFIKQYDSQKGIFRRIFGDHHAVRSLKKFLAIEYHTVTDVQTDVNFSKFNNFVYVNKRRQNYSQSHTFVKKSIAYEFIKKWRFEFIEKSAVLIQQQEQQQEQHAINSRLLDYEPIQATPNSLINTCSVEPRPVAAAPSRRQDDYYRNMTPYRLGGLSSTHSTAANSNRLFNTSGHRLGEQTAVVAAAPALRR
jgi:hypothetical protein